MPTFKRSSKCDTGDSCVEIGHDDDIVYMRDSKPFNDGTVLRFTNVDWMKFLRNLPQRET